MSIAIAGLVVAYLAWIRPHSPREDTNRSHGAAPAPAGAATAGAPAPAGSAQAGPTADPATAPSGDALSSLTPVAGAHNVKATGADLTIACPTGETDDLRRTVEYELLGKYRSLDAQLRVSKARDADTPLQWKVFTDGHLAANHIVRRGTPIPVHVELSGTQKMRIQVTCQFPDGEIALRNPALPR